MPNLILQGLISICKRLFKFYFLVQFHPKLAAFKLRDQHDSLQPSTEVDAKFELKSLKPVTAGDWRLIHLYDQSQMRKRPSNERTNSKFEECQKTSQFTTIQPFTRDNMHNVLSINISTHTVVWFIRVVTITSLNVFSSKCFSFASVVVN